MYNFMASIKRCLFQVTPPEGAKSHHYIHRLPMLWSFFRTLVTHIGLTSRSTLSSDLNTADWSRGGSAWLQHRADSFSEFDQLVGLLRECARQNLCVYLQNGEDMVLLWTECDQTFLKTDSSHQHLCLWAVVSCAFCNAEELGSP